MPRWCLGWCENQRASSMTPGGSGSIVVGAGMHGASERGRHGELSAQAEMIVVRADHDVFAGFAGQVGADIMDRFHFARDIDIQVEAQCFRQGERFRMQVLIDAASMASRFLPASASHLFTTLAFT